MLQYFDSIRKIIENNPSAYAIVVFNREGTVEYCIFRLPSRDLPGWFLRSSDSLWER
jgi:hypothetical protein